MGSLSRALCPGSINHVVSCARIKVTYPREQGIVRSTVSEMCANLRYKHELNNRPLSRMTLRIRDVAYFTHITAPVSTKKHHHQGGCGSATSQLLYELPRSHNQEVVIRSSSLTSIILGILHSAVITTSELSNKKPLQKGVKMMLPMRVNQDVGTPQLVSIGNDTMVTNSCICTTRISHRVAVWYTRVIFLWDSRYTSIIKLLFLS